MTDKGGAGATGSGMSGNPLYGLGQMVGQGIHDVGGVAISPLQGLAHGLGLQPPGAAGPGAPGAPAAPGAGMTPQDRMMQVGQSVAQLGAAPGQQLGGMHAGPGRMGAMPGMGAPAAGAPAIPTGAPPQVQLPAQQLSLQQMLADPQLRRLLTAGLPGAGG